MWDIFLFSGFKLKFLEASSGGKVGCRVAFFYPVCLVFRLPQRAWCRRLAGRADACGSADAPQVCLLNVGSLAVILFTIVLVRIMPGYLKCEYCSYSTAIAADLSSHRRSHGNNKNHPRRSSIFGCKECAFCGTSSGSLQKHMKRAHSQNAQK